MPCWNLHVIIPPYVLYYFSTRSYQVQSQGPEIPCSRELENILHYSNIRRLLQCCPMTQVDFFFNTDSAIFPEAVVTKKCPWPTLTQLINQVSFVTLTLK